MDRVVELTGKITEAVIKQGKIVVVHRSDGLWRCIYQSGAASVSLRGRTKDRMRFAELVIDSGVGVLESVSVDGVVRVLTPDNSFVVDASENVVVDKIVHNLQGVLQDLS